MVAINVLLLLVIFALVVGFALAHSELWSFISTLQSRIIHETEKRRELELRVKALEDERENMNTFRSLMR